MTHSINFANLERCGGTLVAEKTSPLEFSGGILELKNFDGGNAIAALTNSRSGLHGIESFAVMKFPSREKWHEFVHSSIPTEAVTTSSFKKELDTASLISDKLNS